jgi:hypothetical protein
VQVDLHIFVGLNLMREQVRTDDAITLDADSEAHDAEKVVVAG